MFIVGSLPGLRSDGDHQKTVGFGSELLHNYCLSNPLFLFVFYVVYFSLIIRYCLFKITNPFSDAFSHFGELPDSKDNNNDRQNHTRCVDWSRRNISVKKDSNRTGNTGVQGFAQVIDVRGA